MHPFNGDAPVVFDPRATLPSNGLAVCDPAVARGAASGRVYYCGAGLVEVDGDHAREDEFVCAHQDLMDALTQTVWCVVSQYVLADGSTRWSCGTLSRRLRALWLRSA